VPIHPPGTLQTLPLSAHIGTIDKKTMPQGTTMPTDEECRVARARAALPPPQAVLNLSEIEVRTTYGFLSHSQS